MKAHTQIDATGTAVDHAGKGRAACLAVGSELLGDLKLDRNSLEITRVLAANGFEVCEKRVVGDCATTISSNLRDLASRNEVVVVTGGLGPTADDVTREGVAEAFGRELCSDPEIEAWLRDRYRKLSRPMPQICKSMARVVGGARVLLNQRGSAPGMLVDVGESVVAVFPGVPWEMQEMLTRDLAPELSKRSKGKVRANRTLLLAGVVESEIEERIAHVYNEFGRENVTILASYGVLRLVLSCRCAAASINDRLDVMESAFREILGDDVAGTDVDSVAAALVPLLIRRGLTLATAESCTGGLVGAALTGVSGSSEAYLGGIVSYSNEAKMAFVDVPEALLIEHGAVSSEVAGAMAEGVRRRFDADWGLGVTGIAGPTGGTADKPVGLVHWAVAGPSGAISRHRVFRGGREIVRQWSVNMVLDLLRRSIADGRSR